MPMLGRLAARLKGIVTPEAHRVARQLDDLGYAKLEAVLTGSECDAIVEAFDRYVIENKQEADQFLMPTQRHSRLTNMHLVSDAARQAIAKPRIMGALDRFFGSKAYVATSLFFEQSSEQGVHRDTPFFHTKPNNLFAGVWIALEDVAHDAGPLRYFPKGHRLQVEPGKAVDAAGILPCYYEYVSRIEEAIKTDGIVEETALIKKGDCFIWHPELPHAGSPILTKGKTRKSMVFHCSPESETMYGWEEFFGVTPFGPKHSLLVDMTMGRRMLHHDRPMFAENN